MAKLTAGTYPAYFDNYIQQVNADTVKEAIEKYSTTIRQFFKSIPEEKAGYRYAEGKWTIKDLLQHVIDAERIFAYRALRIARQDRTPLPGFEENAYASAAKASKRNWEDLLEEFEAVRKSTDLLFASFTQEDLEQSGVTNDSPNTVLAICFITFGHLLHHKKIIEERYLQS
jgi:uncharacterized damage-inducible protein DinB